MTSTRSAANPGLPVSRSQLEHMIQDAIDILDMLDADPDLEENGDLEPSIGTCHMGVVDAEMDTSDDEPSLGSLSAKINQCGWAAGMDDEREEEHDGREPDADYEPDSDDEPTGDEKEPSLGSFDRITNQEHAYRQTAATCFPNQDQEADPTEHRGPPYFASDADVEVARDAGRRVQRIAARKRGLPRKGSENRPRSNVSNISLIPLAEWRI